MSAYARHQIGQAIRDAIFVPKPIDLEELTLTIKSVLRLWTPWNISI